VSNQLGGRIILKSPANHGGWSAPSSSHLAETLTSALQLASHLARGSDEYSPLLQAIFSAQKLMYILLLVSSRLCSPT
jgi:hypothetical protein